ncbi:MAG: hypothetical protein B7733_26540 [Myxococcales bacterium FL481]|nr:MAG: hypothetical protein B7733_26540 [Myxococcales bacterium FL481]
MRRVSSIANKGRSRWIRVLLFGGLLCTVLGAGVWAYPYWAAPLLRSQLQERMARRDLEFTVDDLTLTHGRVRLDGMHVRQADVELRLERVDVAFSRPGWFSTEVDVESVRAVGGRLSGSVATVREMAQPRTADPASGPSPATGRSVSLVPRNVEVRDLALSLSREAGQPVQFEAQLTFTGDARRREGTVTLRDLSAEVAAGRRVAAAEVQTDLARDEAGGIAFPLRLRVAGGNTSISPTIAVADVSGEIQLLDRDISALRVDLSGGFGESGAGRLGANKLWSVQGELARDLTRGRVELEMEAFALGKIPEVLARLPLVASEQATVGGRLAVDFADGKADLAGELAIAGLHVSHPTLAPGVVRNVGFSADLRARLDPAARKLTVEHAILSRQGVSLALEGEFVHTEAVETRRYRLRAHTAKTPCQEVLDAIPQELVPSLVGFRLGGTFELDLEADISYADLDAATIGGKVDLRRCRVRKVPARVSANRLAGGFSHRVVMLDGSERIVRLYPGAPSYTALSDISPNMVAAVLTTEDGGFWRHSGFLTSQFSEAMRRNLKAGRIRLGASTITMQMVKNVLLSHERTFSRKLQELFLTWYVERTLSKERIMEIYLNVIEFGPGVYGVTHAASHYFGKTPQQLNSLEAAYLALMLPSPVRRHVHYCKGEPSRRFDAKLRRIHEIMHSRGHIDDLEFFLWNSGTVSFDDRDRQSEAACLREIDRLLEGTHRQRAVSGLLEGDHVPEDDGPPAWLDDSGLELYDDDPSASDAPGRPAMDG